MKKFIFFIILFGSFLSFVVRGVEPGKWILTVEDNYCYIGSAPIKEEGDYTNRDITYVLVYRINKTNIKTIQKYHTVDSVVVFIFHLITITCFHLGEGVVIQPI